MSPGYHLNINVMLDDTVAKANTHHYAKLSSIVQTVTKMPQFFNHDLSRLVL